MKLSIGRLTADAAPFLLPNICFHGIIKSVVYRKDYISLELSNNNHSVFSMSYYLILVIKYRRKVIDDQINHKLRELFEKLIRSVPISSPREKNMKDVNTA